MRNNEERKRCRLCGRSMNVRHNADGSTCAKDDLVGHIDYLLAALKEISEMPSPYTDIDGNDAYVHAVRFRCMDAGGMID